MADNERWYKINDLEYPSVTTVLGASIAKQSQLIPWAVKGYHKEVSKWLKGREERGLGEHRQSFELDDAMDSLIEQREHTGLSGARVGSLAHDLISTSIGYKSGEYSVDWCKEVLGHQDAPADWLWLDEIMSGFFKHHEVEQTSENVNQVLNVILAWEQWCEDFDVGPGHAQGWEPKHTWEVAHSEKLVYFEPSKIANGGKPNNRYAGTADLIIQNTKNPKLKYLIDIKTGNLYKEALYQVAAYAFAYAETMYEELGIDNGGHEHFIKRCFLLQLHKDDIAKQRYTLKEAKPWKDLVHQGFTPCLDWFYTFRTHTPGRQITRENFQSAGE